MYPRNSASPPEIAVGGAVVQISDGAVQTTGTTTKVKPKGGSWTAAGGTTSFGDGGSPFYIPTQAETDYESFSVEVYKAGCLPASITVVTTASSTAGKAILDPTQSGVTIPTVTTLTNAPSDSSGVTTLLSRIVGTLLAGNHNAQSGDGYGILNNGTYGNAALKTLIDVIDGIVDTIVARVVGTIAAGTHNPQSGDAYARLGAPTGASVSADIADVEGKVDDLEGRLTATRAGYLDQLEHIHDDTDGNNTKLNTIIGYIDTEVASILTAVDTEVAAIKAKTDNLPASPSSLTAQQVWEYATRTLSAFGFTVAATVADKTGYSLTAAYDAAKAASTQVSVDTIDGIVDAIKLKTDTIPASPSTLTAQQVWEYATRTLSAFGFSVTVGTNNDKTGYSLTATPPTSAEIADKILGRTVAGGADGERTVKDALRVLRNKVVIDTATGIITVYAEDDTTPAWTGVVTTTVGADPITAVDPA